MRFAHSFTLGPNSYRPKRRLVFHQRIGAQSGVPCDQPLSSVFSPLAILLGPNAGATQGPRSLTEFPFQHNFFALGLERQ